MSEKDDRIKMMNEILSGIKVCSHVLLCKYCTSEGNYICCIIIHVHGYGQYLASKMA